MIRLLYAPTSPYVRKVMASAHLLGVAGRIELLDSAAHPIDRDARIAVHNPLAKVPTLILDDGRVLYDSRVICEYLDDLAPGHGLFPKVAPARWQALARQALGDGLLDAALLARYELSARPVERQWDAWRSAQLVKVNACVDAIERQADSLATCDLTIGEVTLACALGYLDFRFAEFDWRATHPKSARWNAGVQSLPALRDTIPHA
ncbi:MAG TPA: glutathione S-transferase [Casimicrobiaceae bacterium]|jgi:glutathione S-transferase|nr:glutathione S-transferase [Casimicrobiaceae bacterium]